MGFNLSQNAATLLHLLFAGIQVYAVGFTNLTAEQQGLVVGFFSLVQAALGHRGYQLTPAGAPVPEPPGKEAIEAQGK
jgi:hypothetical protein